LINETLFVLGFEVEERIFGILKTRAVLRGKDFNYLDRIGTIRIENMGKQGI
jgi:hypothetical protein